MREIYGIDVSPDLVSAVTDSGRVVVYGPEIDTYCGLGVESGGSTRPIGQRQDQQTSKINSIALIETARGKSHEVRRYPEVSQHNSFSIIFVSTYCGEDDRPNPPTQC